MISLYLEDAQRIRRTKLVKTKAAQYLEKRASTQRFLTEVLAPTALVCLYVIVLVTWI